MPLELTLVSPRREPEAQKQLKFIFQGSVTTLFVSIYDCELYRVVTGTDRRQLDSD